MEIKYNFDKTYSYTDGRKTEIDIGQTIKSNIDFWKEKYFELEKNSIPISLIEKKIEEVRQLKFEDERLDRVSIDFAVNKFKEILEEN